MPYGSFTKKEISLVIQESMSRNLGAGPTSYPVNDTTETFESVSSSSVRSGSNTSRYFDVQHPDSYTVSFKKYRKKIGERTVKRNKKFYEKSNESGIVTVTTRRVDTTIPVFVTTYRPVMKKIKRPGLNNHLFAPNALSYYSTNRWINQSSNTFTRTLLHSDTENPPYSEYTCKVIGWPIGMKVQSTVSSYFWPETGPNDLLQFNYASLSSSPPQLVDLGEEALKKLYVKVASEFPTYLVDIAQSNKTVATVKKIGLTALKVIKAIKRLDVQAAKNVIRGVTPEKLSSIWLEYIYGVAPTLGTINASIDLYNREARTWRSYSASASIKLDEVISHPHPSTGDAWAYVDGTRSTNVTVRYGCVMSGDSSFSRYVQRDFSADGALGLAYELIPFSFMLDWVYDLGSFINSRSIFHNHLLYCWKTVFIKEFSALDFVPYDDFYTKSEFTPFSIGGQHVRCVRTVVHPSELPDMPMPKLKTLREGLSLQRSVNAAAIAITLMGR